MCRPRSLVRTSRGTGARKGQLRCQHGCATAVHVQNHAMIVVSGPNTRKNDRLEWWRIAPEVLLPGRGSEDGQKDTLRQKSGYPRGHG